MQFLRIAGDDVPKPKKKRAPKVEKVRPFLYVFCVWLPHKYYCSEVYISRKIICLKLLWKTKSVECLCHAKLKRWVTFKFYSHCEAYHSIIRWYDHSLVRQYGRHINLLHRLNMYFRISTTLYIAEIEADSLQGNNIYSACIDDCEKWKMNSLVFFKKSPVFIFLSELSIKELFLHLPSSVVL